MKFEFKVAQWLKDAETSLKNASESSSDESDEDQSFNVVNNKIDSQ